ncbi:MAG TPA: hypothetical protein VK674_06050 [Candidatus Limnocylindria bacterium]|nr:hypothetical protein [Candidatus Limnocylindria bacterium]
MPDNLAVPVAVVAGLLNVLGFVPYLRDTLRRKTKPERAMWWIYAVLFGLLFAAQMEAGAGWLLFVTGAYIASSVVIAILSLWYGYGSFHKRDTISLVVAAVGLLLWQLSDRPLVAIVLVIIVDFAGFWLTLVKTWHAPHSETLISWQLAFVTAVLSIFSVGAWTLDVLIYPVYAVLATALIVWMIMYRRTKVTEDLPDF